MKTLTEKYRGVLNESFSKKQFVRDARIAHPHLITQFNGFDDTVSILKQKGMISEEDKMPEYAEFHNYSDETIRRGIDYELAGMGLMPEDSVSAEDQAKAKKKVLKNLKKDPLHYLNLVSGESSKVDKHDKEVEVKKNNHVDKFNGLKKAELKESKSVLSENLEKIKKSISRQLPSNLDGDVVNGVFHDIFSAAENLQDEQPGTSAIAALYNSSEMYEEEYEDEGQDEEMAIAQKITKILEPAYMKSENVDEGAAKKLDMIRQHLHKKFTDPNNPKNKVIDDKMIDGFFSVAPDNLLDMDMDEVELEYDNYVDANYDRVDEDDMVYDPKTRGLKIAKSVDDVIDPHDYVEIGQGYLKGFKRPHSLKDADLETLGRKIVKVLARGDINKAKAKFVDEVMGIDRKGNKKPEDTPSNYTKANEQMTDQQMADIAKYGREDKPVKAFKPGDNWSNDFDYEGMLEFGMKIRLNTPIPTLKALYSSFEDVNYHTENSHLGMAIDAIEAKDKSEALDHIRNFKKAIKQTLVQFNEGANPNRRELEEAGAVVTERVGALEEFISLIQDRAAESGFSEAEEAEEVIEALQDHYSLNEGLFDRIGAKFKGGLASLGQKGKNFLAYMKGDKDAIRDPKIAAAFAKVASTAGNLQKAASDIQKDLARLFPKDVLDALPDEAKEAVNNYYNVVKAAVDQSTTMAQLKEEEVNEEPNEGNKFEAERLKAIKAGEDHFEVDGKKFPVKGVGADDKKRAAMAKESVKAIITKVLEEGVINEAATQELAKMADSYAGFEGMKAVVMSLQDIVTDIERYYDNTRSKIQKAFDSMGEVRNEEGLKVGGFLAPAIESAFNKDLRPAIKKGFTKGLDQPKVKVLSQADLDAARMGNPVAEAEPKQTVYSPVNEEKNEEEEKDIKHDCANHVLHEKYGHGICLEEQHTLLEDGTVTHYDVFFKEGSKTVKNIPTEELKIITSSHHGHKRKKKK